uniref:Secreted protein n=1 Tax=Caenorhabditis tropicalis TaxID=1561998 RepID=A0A1I7TVE0_9PELO
MTSFLLALVEAALVAQAQYDEPEEEANLQDFSSFFHLVKGILDYDKHRGINVFKDINCSPSFSKMEFLVYSVDQNNLRKIQ